MFFNIPFFRVSVSTPNPMMNFGVKNLFTNHLNKNTFTGITFRLIPLYKHFFPGFLFKIVNILKEVKHYINQHSSCKLNVLIDWFEVDLIIILQPAKTKARQCICLGKVLLHPIEGFEKPRCQETAKGCRMMRWVNKAIMHALNFT